MATEADSDPATDAGEGRPGPSTRDAILDAAERLFAARGVDGVAVRDLAREVGLTPSSLYNHFPGKQAIYEAVLERGLAPFGELVRDAGPPDVDPGRIGASIEVMVEHLVDHPHLATLLQRSILEAGGGLDELLRRWVEPLLESSQKAVVQPGPRTWEEDEIPHLVLGLQSLLLGYFTHGPAFHALGVWKEDPLSEETLVVQRRFLRKAIHRLLSPFPPPEDGPSGS